MTGTRPRLVLISAFAVALALIAGCSGSQSETSKSSAALFNDADVVFAQNMIPHHQQAVELSTIALASNRETSASLEALAMKIQTAQQPEIELMTGWLESWGKKLPNQSDHSNMDHSNIGDMGGMDGMMTADEMTTLQGLKGPEFDTVWMQMMIRHHEGAVKMARTVVTDGSNAEVKTLAGKITTAQESEIAEMKEVLEK